MSERPRRPGAHELLAEVLDEGSFASWDQAPLEVAPPGSTYAAELAAAAERAGTDESIITGEGRIHGHRVAVIVGQPGEEFFGGFYGDAPVSLAEVA